jgi:hypothetical protein
MNIKEFHPGMVTKRRIVHAESISTSREVIKEDSTYNFW